MIASAERAPVLEKYELLEEIGHGGMATVYRAKDRRLGREVAVKVIHRHLRENTEVARRFVSEAQAVAKVKHPNIVEVYDVSDEGAEERYLVVELVRGTTLRKLINTHGYLPPEIAATIGLDIASALAHAHELGIIHRDMKPENVLVELPSLEPSAIRSSREALSSLIKITDFGIAKLLDAQGVTSTGQVLGSPAHMAPEQIEGGEVSARSDVFGLGVLLYECMVGRLPFDGKNPAQVLRRVLEGSFTPADRARPTVGARWSAIVSKALAKDAQDRFASAGELATALSDELKLAGFAEPQRELSEFLSDPETYRTRFEEQIVQRLIHAGQEAQKQRNAPLAAAYFNRALAHRPEDVELLTQVSTLARGERLRKGAVRIAAGLVGSALIVGAGIGLMRLAKGLRDEARVPDDKPKVVAPPPKPVVVRPPSGPSAAIAAPVLPKPRKPPVLVRPPSAPVEPAKAWVKILIDGPQNATVFMNGREIAWFGPPRELPVGEHVFEFVPQDGECCEGRTSLRQTIRQPASPTEVQTVQGRIKFKPATLEFTGSAAKARCGELGEFQVPSNAQVPMTAATLTGRCTVFPETAGLAPIQVDVNLRPGGVFTIPGP